MNPPPGPLGVLGEEATSEGRLLTGRDSRIQEFFRVARISREFVRGFRALHFAPPCITFFGSARFGEGSEYYQPSREVAAAVGALGFAVMTGGGPGLMEAANRGARDVGARSFGATIDIGREPANRFVDKRIAFHYFFARKVVLVKYSYGFVMLPGGFGTLDEMFEALTLMQTDRLNEFPIVLFGTSYWGGLIDWVRNTLLAQGAITTQDLDRLVVTDDPADVIAALRPVAAKLEIAPPSRAAQQGSMATRAE